MKSDGWYVVWGKCGKLSGKPYVDWHRDIAQILSFIHDNCFPLVEARMNISSQCHIFQWKPKINDKVSLNCGLKNINFISHYFSSQGKNEMCLICLIFGMCSTFLNVRQQTNKISYLCLTLVYHIVVYLCTCVLVYHMSGVQFHFIFFPFSREIK